jgi:hypothetical protein
MSLKDFARELYRLEREVEKAEKALAEASVEDYLEKEFELKRLVVERDRYRAIMASKKEKPPSGRVFR